MSSRIGLLFPGQGSHYVGMGRDLFERAPAVREMYRQANRILGFDLAALSFEGPEPELRETRNTQPAILVHSLAVLELLRQDGLAGMVAAGHSLGEYSALAAAGALAFEDALRLVRRRGELMYESGVRRAGAMTAVVGLTPRQVEEVCRQASDGEVVVAANFNSPQQTVLSGDVAAVARAEALAKEAGARMTKRLEVSGAFHSPLMEPAAAGLWEALQGVTFRKCRFPVVSNLDARPRREPEDVRQALMRQLTAPVRWVDTLQVMAREGVDFFAEVGPGSVLGGFVRRTLPQAQVVAVGDGASLERWRERVEA